MEMHQVRYFLGVARTLNFTRAAEDCHVAQPSLTRAIKQLEEELGADLFRRERNLTHLTEFGQRMLPFLQQCYDSAVSAKQLAASMKSGAVQPMSIAVSQSVDVSLIAGFLAELVRAFKGLELRFLRGNVAEIGEYLKKGEVEVAVAGPLGDEWGRLDAWPLFTEKLLLAVNADHPLARETSADPGVLAKERVIKRTFCEATGDFERLLQQRGIALKATHSTCTEADLLALLEANVGVGMLPQSVPISNKVKRLDLSGIEATRTISCYGVAGRQRSTPAATLIKMLRAADWPRLIGAPQPAAA